MLKRTGNPIFILLLACLWLTACPLPLLETPPGQPDGEGRLGAAGLGDPIYPHLGNGGYNVTPYDISLAVDMAGNSISATTTIQAQATEPLRVFNLDFLGLTIDSIQVNGQPAGFKRAGSELTWKICSAPCGLK